MFIDPQLPHLVLPDELDLVIEAADMMTVLAAQRLVRIDAMRREALRDATRNGRVLTEVVERGVRLELAAALRITEHAAGDLLSLSQAMVHSYPAVLASMERARITERHAQILIAAVDEVEPEFRERVLEPGIALAESEPVGTFRRKLRTLVDKVRSATLTERYEWALTGRRVVVEPDRDGMGWAHVYGPLVALHAAFGRTTAMAKAIVGGDGETRTLDQVRADVVLDLLIDGAVESHPGQARGVKATVFVTAPVLALLHESDASRAAAGIDPPVVEGIGPIPLPVARELAGGASGWTRVLTHPETGMVLSVGRDQYRPPPALQKLVKWRADRCMGPGCGMPASRCDVDHNVDWALGGRTELTNLGPLCEGHHTVRHHTDWRIEQVAGSGGAIRWTSPSGRHYLVEPERAVPVFRSAESSGAPF
ncbi:HNH endonuclease signature motif containing protein [Microbacterium yannicii]|uniref:HNH endonuclease signature motif containing protein n=1 Tax=Microbacterium yannicii TaxID=671622 RepID=A0ABP9M4I8_9MICO|nr:HNH endonuclease signature motif containing protein [Microbacterium yannicii]MCO5954728.1 HNH endonuclease [Microbacterium yannicii]